MWKSRYILSHLSIPVTYNSGWAPNRTNLVFTPPAIYLDSTEYPCLLLRGLLGRNSNITTVTGSEKRAHVPWYITHPLAVSVTVVLLDRAQDSPSTRTRTARLWPIDVADGVRVYSCENEVVPFEYTFGSSAVSMGDFQSHVHCTVSQMAGNSKMV